MLNVFNRYILLTVIMSISACSIIQPGTDEERVFERAEKMQAALLKHNFDVAYKYMSPGYRNLNTLQEFKSSYAGVYNWVSADVKGVSCEEDTICKVNVEIGFDAGPMMSSSRQPTVEKFVIPRASTQTWLKLDGEWWFSKRD